MGSYNILKNMSQAYVCVKQLISINWIGLRENDQWQCYIFDNRVTRHLHWIERQQKDQGTRWLA